MMTQVIGCSKTEVMREEGSRILKKPTKSIKTKNKCARAKTFVYQNIEKRHVIGDDTHTQP